MHEYISSLKWTTLVQILGFVSKFWLVFFVKWCLKLFKMDYYKAEICPFMYSGGLWRDIFISSLEVSELCLICLLPDATGSNMTDNAVDWNQFKQPPWSSLGRWSVCVALIKTKPPQRMLKHYYCCSMFCAYHTVFLYAWEPVWPTSSAQICRTEHGVILSASWGSALDLTFHFQCDEQTRTVI